VLKNESALLYIPASDWVEEAERFVREMTLIFKSLQVDIDIKMDVDMRLISAWATAEIGREALKFISVSLPEEWFTRDAYDELVADLRLWAKMALEKKLSAAETPLL
jgi:hypothetical protein